MLLELQNRILDFSPALYPLLTFPISFFQSWHCTIMCSPYITHKTNAQRNLYLQGRMISYTAAGGVFGALGSGLRNLLEYEFLGGLSFFIFMALSISLVFTWFGFSKKSWHFPKIQILHDYFKKGKAPSFIQGLLSVALPCGILYQILTLAALSHSIWGGALIALVHATTSTPALWSGSWIATKLSKAGKWFRYTVYLGMCILMLLNLFFFAGSLLHSETEAKSKILFCL